MCACVQRFALQDGTFGTLDELFLPHTFFLLAVFPVANLRPSSIAIAVFSNPLVDPCHFHPSLD